jgi:hypothetical protein
MAARKAVFIIGLLFGVPVVVALIVIIIQALSGYK